MNSPFFKWFGPEHVLKKKGKTKIIKMYIKTNTKNLRRQIIYTLLTIFAAKIPWLNNTFTWSLTPRSSNSSTLLPYKSQVLNTTSCWFQLTANQEEFLLKIGVTINFFSVGHRILTPLNCLSRHFTRGKKKNKQAEEVLRVFYPPFTCSFLPVATACQSW